MTQRGERQIEKLCEEATCPACEYSLRGLREEVVICPECGLKINIVKFVTTQWKGPWYKAPMYDALAIPVGWTLFVVATIYFTSYSNRDGSFEFSVWHGLGLILAIAVGAWIMRVINRRFGDADAVRLTILLHVILAVYVACAFVIFQELESLLALTSFFVWSECLRLGMIFGAITFVIICARRIEKYVGGRCIRRYLRLATES